MSGTIGVATLPELSVIVATRDRAKFLSRALESLARQRNAPPFEVIVVDNGSRDETPSVVAERRGAADVDVRRLYVPEPNRGAARNAGIAAARGRTVVFVDDDVWLPEGFLAAHASAHPEGSPAHAVSGPIINVPTYEDRPTPSAVNFSNAFLCTCNVSVPRSSLVAVGGFDENFKLYGWEDTELGLRLRERGVRRGFAWDAHLYHIKPPQSETLAVVLRKTIERGRMAARLLAKNGGWRTRLATGAYQPNLLRAALVAPRWSLPWYAALALDENVPAALRAFARAQLLDGAYVAELRAGLAEAAR